MPGAHLNKAENIICRLDGPCCVITNEAAGNAIPDTQCYDEQLPSGNELRIEWIRSRENKKAMISEYFLSFVVFELEFGDSFRGIQMNFRACDFVFGWNLKKWNVDTRENASHAEIL